MKTLRTERLELVPPTAEHVDVIAANCTDPDIIRWTVVPSPYTRADAQWFVSDAQEKAPKNIPVWMIELDGTPIGQIDLRQPLGPGRNEVGFLQYSGYRGQGYMTEALRTVAQYAFDEGCDALGWQCWIKDGETNWASTKVAWKAGFTFDGVIRAGDKDRDGLVDVLTATLLPGEAMTPSTPWFGPEQSRPAVPSPRDPEALVRQFHETYAMPIATGEPSVDFDRVGMRMALIAEEFTELVTAMYGQDAGQTVADAYGQAVLADDHSRDVIESADALGDLIYVIYGMALEAGISLPDVLAEVQNSNLSKLGEDGLPIYREDGKVLKGPGFFPPNIAAVLERARLAERGSWPL